MNIFNFIVGNRFKAMFFINIVALICLTIYFFIIPARYQYAVVFKPSFASNGELEIPTLPLYKLSEMEADIMSDAFYDSNITHNCNVEDAKNIYRNVTIGLYSKDGYLIQLKYLGNEVADNFTCINSLLDKMLEKDKARYLTFVKALDDNKRLISNYLAIASNKSISAHANNSIGNWQDNIAQLISTLNKLELASKAPYRDEQLKLEMLSKVNLRPNKLIVILGWMIGINIFASLGIYAASRIERK